MDDSQAINLTIEKLGKCYYLPDTGSLKRGGAFRQGLRSFAAWLQGAEAVTTGKREFWALRDVSLKVRRGTILGVIGANGAGKTTLLKIIARVTPPTEGTVRGRGRVVSLLELGAGFNPEVSARENIFMNAAMYGVPRSDVLKHFDEIIAFAEIEQFVDTPLKHYSSGMYLRIAFSVAVNMQPEVLLADEILAVGDLVFQERCLTRVAELGKEGLTVLFVSHDMEAIMRVCNEVVWLSNGRIEKHGDPEEVVTAYQNAAWATAAASRTEKGHHSNRHASLVGARLVSASGKEIGAAPVDEDVFIRMRFMVSRTSVKVTCGFDLTHRGGLLFRSMDSEAREITTPGGYEGWCRIPARLLTEIMYGVNVFIYTEAEGKEASLIIYNAVTFMGYDSALPVEQQKLLKGALLAPKLDWKLVSEEQNVVV